MVLRKAGAALSAGCTMGIEPSPETPLSVLVSVELAVHAGFDKAALTILTSDLKALRVLEGACVNTLSSER